MSLTLNKSQCDEKFRLRRVALDHRRDVTVITQAILSLFMDRDEHTILSLSSCAHWKLPNAKSNTERRAFAFAV